MRKAVVAATAALTVLAGCRSDVLDAEKLEKAQRPDSVTEILAGQHPEVSSLALRYSAPELMLTKWDNPEKLNLQGASATVYREHAANTEPGMVMLKTATGNVGILMEAVRSGEILPDDAGYQLELNEASHQIYMIYGDPKSLAKTVPMHRGGPQVAVGRTEDGRTDEILTLTASFPRGHFYLHSELDNTRWLLQSAVCANFINVIPGQSLEAEIRNNLANGENYTEVLATKVDGIAASICQSLALAQVAKDGEALGKVNGYDYYDWLLREMHKGGEVANYFPLPRTVYNQIVT